MSQREIDEAQAEVDSISKKIESYSIGDRPQSPPVSLYAELDVAREALRVAVTKDTERRVHPTKERLIPTGVCWCGCKRNVGLGSFFAAGHDKRAVSAIVLVEYGGVPEFLITHGYGPKGPKNTNDTFANELKHRSKSKKIES